MTNILQHTIAGGGTLAIHKDSETVPIHSPPHALYDGVTFVVWAFGFLIVCKGFSIVYKTIINK